MDQNQLVHYGVRGMKWGVRRYQNKDGSLTPAGKKRYDRDVQSNLSKKKENRIDTSKPDPSRWVKEDLERTKKTVDATSNLVREMKNIDRESQPKPVKKKMDLSSMSDQELRQKIDRELLERRYNDIFGETETPKVSKGREYASAILDGVGAALGITGSALAIALAIKDLRG